MTPLRGSYAANAALVLLALCPQLVVSTALALLEPTIATGFGVERGDLALAGAMADGGYALGAVLAADLSVRFERARLFAACQTAFVLGAVVDALAPNVGIFVAGAALCGLATGTLLVVATPSIVRDFPVPKLAVTGAIFLVGFFGATTLGPLIGGAVAHLDAWRRFYGVVALAGAANVGLGRLVVAPTPPKEPDRPVDTVGVALAVAGTALAFYGSVVLEAGPEAPVGWACAALGLGSLGALLVQQYRSDDPFVPVKPLSTSLPVLGLACAMISGAAFVALLELVETLLTQGRGTPALAAGLELWPAVAGAAVAALVFRALFASAFVSLVALGGMLALALGSAVLGAGAFESGSVSVEVGAALLGLGAGATVSPSLFLAAFGVPLKQLGPTFALVELLRSAAAFLPGPVLLGFALAAARGGVPGAPPLLAPMLAVARIGAWLIAGVLAATALGLVVAFRRFGLALEPPDLTAWHDRDELALASPDVSP